MAPVFAHLWVTSSLYYRLLETSVLETSEPLYIFIYATVVVLFVCLFSRFIVGKEEIPTHSFSPEAAFSKTERKIKPCEKISQRMNLLALTKKLMDKV